MDILFLNIRKNRLPYIKLVISCLTILILLNSPPYFSAYSQSTVKSAHLALPFRHLHLSLSLSHCVCDLFWPYRYYKLRVLHLLHSWRRTSTLTICFSVFNGLSISESLAFPIIPYLQLWAQSVFGSMSLSNLNTCRETQGQTRGKNDCWFSEH